MQPASYQVCLAWILWFDIGSVGLATLALASVVLSLALSDFQQYSLLKYVWLGFSVLSLVGHISSCSAGIFWFDILLLGSVMLASGGGWPVVAVVRVCVCVYVKHTVFYHRKPWKQAEWLEVACLGAHRTRPLYPICLKPGEGEREGSLVDWQD